MGRMRLIVVLFLLTLTASAQAQQPFNSGGGGPPGQQTKDPNVIYAKDYLACNGVADDRLKFKALVETGGVAAGKTLNMSKCMAALSSPGAGSAVASPATGTAIVGDGSNASGFTLMTRVCTTGNSIGAGCSVNADCAGSGTCGADNRFAPTGASTYTVFTSAVGASDLTLSDVVLKTNQLPVFGTCVTTNAGEACRSRCQSPANIANFTCDNVADCANCANDTGNCATTCTGAGISPAGDGSIVWVDWSNAARSTIKGTRVLDIEKSPNVIKINGGTVVENDLTNSVMVPALFNYLGNNFPTATTRAISNYITSTGAARIEGNYVNDTIGGPTGSASPTLITTAAGSVVDSNLITASGASATGVSGVTSTVNANTLTLSGATAKGILGASGSANQMTNNVITVNGAGSTGIKSDGADAQIVGNYVYKYNSDGESSAGIMVTGGSTSIIGNFIKYFGAAAGIDLNTSPIGSQVIGNHISGVRQFTWGAGILIGSQQVIIEGNMQYNNGMCVRSNGHSPPSAGGIINYLYVNNRCFQPQVACGALITGTHFSNNYCAWVDNNATALWIGDSGRAANEICDGAGSGLPVSGGGDRTWACCNTTDKGNCDGTSEGASPGSGNSTVGYGYVTSHTNVVGNLFYNSDDNRSQIKFASVGKRCGSTPANTADCTGATSGGARGNNCFCATSADCAGTTPTCTAQTTKNVVIDANLFLMSTNNVGIDMLMDDDDFGLSTTEAGGTDTDTLIQGIGIAGNVFALGRPLNISSNSTVKTNITNVGFLANTFQGTNATRTNNWAWTMGVKDDNPVAILMGGSSTALPGSNATQYLPVVGVNINTTETNVDQLMPAGTSFRARCRLGTTLNSGDSRVVTLRKNAGATATTCTISGAGADTCTFPTTEVTWAELDRMDWEFTGASTPTAGEAYCTLFYEITQSELGWQW